jgi:hypothetical protein
MVLLQKGQARMQSALNKLTKRKGRKQQYIQAEETLTVSEVLNLVAATASNSRDNSNRPSKRVRAERHCGRCSETRHNSCTCKVEIEDVEDSNQSKE